MINFAELQEIYRIIILVLLLVMILANGHIIAFSILRTRRWKIGFISFFHILLYYFTLIALSTYLYELELGRNFNYISYYFSTLPLWIYQLFLIVGISVTFVLLRRIKIHQQNTITKVTIKESVDNLPAGLCLSLENSLVVLSNWQIDRLCHILTGQALQNGEVFWNALRRGVLKEGNQRWTRTNNPIITLIDGRTWSFSRRIIDVEGQSVIEITAIDMTDLNDLRVQLEENNKILTEMGSKLRQYSTNIAEIKAKEERLATKMHIHDELGYALLATRQFFRKQESSVQKKLKAEEILHIWKKNISILQGTIEQKKTTVLDSLNSAAKAIGIRIIIEGTLPKDTNATNLILLVAGECLTNSVRHANATELYLKIIGTEQSYIAVFSNDGIIPETKIVEGGGLSALRNKIETAGGVMEISHVPKFVLKVNIPKGGDEKNG